MAITARLRLSIEIVVHIAVENRCFVRDAWIRHGVNWLGGHDVVRLLHFFSML
jgi:hypothetical protein